MAWTVEIPLKSRQNYHIEISQQKASIDTEIIKEVAEEWHNSVSHDGPTVFKNHSRGQKQQETSYAQINP